MVPHLAEQLNIFELFVWTGGWAFFFDFFLVHFF